MKIIYWVRKFSLYAVALSMALAATVALTVAMLNAVGIILPYTVALGSVILMWLTIAASMLCYIIEDLVKTIKEDREGK